MTTVTDTLLRQAFAHRGLHDATHGRPENSRAAFKAAIKAGYGIEMDIQMSRDGRAMVFHDYDLSRLTGAQGPIRQQDADDLTQLHLKGGAETIPTLAEILDLVNGSAPLLIEIKDQDGALGPETCGLEKAVAQVLSSYRGDAFVMSFNPHSIRCMAEYLPTTPRGLVTGAFSKDSFQLVPEKTRNRLRGMPDFQSVGASFISHNVSDLAREQVQDMRRQGVPVLCWTIKSKAEEIEALKLSDNVTFEGYLASQRAT